MGRSNLLALGALLSAVGCAGAAQTPARSPVASASCAGIPDLQQQVAELLAPGQVQRVEPLYRLEHRARAIQLRYVSGAKVYVPAERGMNDGYLERALSCHAASAESSQPNDPLRVANVHDIDVRTRGTLIEIQIEGADRAAGKQILERAQGLREPSTQVEVRQLSSTSEATRL